MATLGVGVIGCGFVGRGAHVPSFRSIDGADLVAVADPDSARLEKSAKKHNVPSTYQDYADLVKDPKVDAVVVAVPTPLHAKVSLAAIEAGKHVLCEMPLAANLDEADQIIDAAQRQGVCLMPGLTFRFTPNYVKVKELIGEGKIGRPLAILYRELIPAADLAKQWPRDAWVWKLDESGGPLYTLSVWSLDLVRWLTGSDIRQVDAATKYTEIDRFGGTLGYDSFATVRMSDGTVASFQYSGSVTHTATASTLEVIGDSTYVLKASGNDLVTLSGEDPAKTEWNVKRPGPGMWGHEQQNTYFVQCILDGKQPEITPEDGRKAMEVALQIGRAT